MNNSFDSSRFSECRLCPRNCGADRNSGAKGYCGVDSNIYITRAALHFWEEPCISGYEDSLDEDAGNTETKISGSGTVFFSGCNLHCCFCQNYEISTGSVGQVISYERLSEIFLELQEKGALNINLVTPTHYVPWIIKALDRAKENGLKLPVLYNSGGYENVDTIKALEGYIDIWMPDMKYKSSELSKKYSNAPDYFDKAAQAINEMVAQIKRRNNGSVCQFTKGVMTQGVIVRHMTLPGAIADSKRVLRYLYESYGNDIYISIMSQYTPMKHILEGDKFPELKEKVAIKDYDRLVEFANKIGIENAFIQQGDIAKESFIPAFNGEGVLH